jgi:hypothetical protein
MPYPEILIAFNVCACAVMILLGFLQRRHLDRYSVAAVCIACADAIGSVLLYGRTEFFFAAAFGLAAILLIHGAVVHFPLYESADPLRSCPAFRGRFVCNHETWVLVALAAGVVSALRV